MEILEVAAQPTPTFTLVTNATTVDVSHSIRLTGTLSMPKTGSVTLEWTINSTGPYSFSEPIINGIYTRDFGFGSGPGTWEIRVIWPGDATSSPATSNTVTITVLPTPPAEPSTEPPTEPTTEPTTEAPTEPPTETPSEPPSETPTETTTEQATEAPTQTPTEQPTETPTETTTEQPTEPTTVQTTETPSESSTTPAPEASPPPTSDLTGGSQPEANIWVPPPANAMAASAVTVAAVGVTSFVAAAAVAPGGMPTGKVTKRLRDLLPSSIKKWLATFIISKRKLTVDEKQGSPFIPTRTETIAYIVSVSVLTFSFSYVKVESLVDILSILPTILATSIVVDIVKTFVLVAYARQQGVWAERKLWYFGLATFLITTFAFRVPFSSPSRSVYHGPKFSKRLGVVLCVASISISLAFAGIFYGLLIGGLVVIGSTGLAMCIISAFFDTFPITPMKGKTIFSYNRLLWAALFILTLGLYGAWLLIL